jgi:hypothetical protein
MQFQIGYGAVADAIPKTERFVVEMVSRGIIRRGSLFLGLL